MNKARIAVIAVSIFALIYQLAFFVVGEDVLYALFALSPFLMAWMIYAVLRFGKPSKDNFDTRFYEDHPYKRNGKEELIQESDEIFSTY